MLWYISDVWSPLIIEEEYPSIKFSSGTSIYSKKLVNIQFPESGDIWDLK